MHTPEHLENVYQAVIDTTSLQLKQIDSRDDGLDFGSIHYLWTIYRRGAVMVGYFSCGSAYTSKPTLQEILLDLFSGVVETEHQDMASFLFELDFIRNEDSLRKGIQIWNVYRQYSKSIPHLFPEYTVSELANAFLELA